ncbi:MAG TPA: thioredoxin-dependent thiol peroxidase [Chitinophagales bacterium]|nr:thioredoxin-dependent thiol peroxidase [Chitinophagales bacterium]
MLEVGAKVPNITVKDQDGKDISLSNYQGQKLIVYFYPKDDTPGCTAEACNFRDNYSELQKHGFALLGVSPDDEKKHLKFIDKHKLPFPLIADTDKALANAFGVWGPKKFMGKEYDGIHRTTFIINEEGVITYVITKVKTKDSTQQILDLIK